VGISQLLKGALGLSPTPSSTPLSPPTLSSFTATRAPIAPHCARRPPLTAAVDEELCGGMYSSSSVPPTPHRPCILTMVDAHPFSPTHTFVGAPQLLCEAPPPSQQRATPGAKGEMKEGERKAGQHAYFHTVQPPHMCWCCTHPMSVMPRQQKGHPMSFWTCGARIDKFTPPKVHFQS
jgi:hypothetical protein